MTEARPPGGLVLRIERFFNAPAEAVFDAWTSAEVLRRWWPAGPDWDTPVAEVDVRVGGKLRLVMRRPDGREFGGGGEYIEVTPAQRLVFTWRWDGPERDEDPQLVEVDFKERPDGTTAVVLTNSGLRDEEAKRLHEEGWQASFDNLDRVLLSWNSDTGRRM
jgi:uncharacterized protein YndB with AHSA1/START domain